MKLRVFISMFWLLAMMQGVSQNSTVAVHNPPADLLSPTSGTITDLWDLVITASNTWAQTVRQSPDWEDVRRAPVDQVRSMAEQGIGVAQLRLGCACFTGRGIAPDANEAVKWLTKAAEKGMAPAQFLLGEACLKGIGITEDFARGVEWLDLAAGQGFADAEFLLGLIYLKGGPGVNQAPARGVKWLVRAAEQGNPLAEQCVGECYAAGNGVKPDADEAARWYKRAADQGLAAAQVLLAGCFLTGSGVEGDPSEAFRWYNRAAQQGSVVAQAALARCCAQGRGVEKSASAAMKWWQQAADNGYPGAQFHLGLGYYSGDGLSRDFTRAVACFEKDAQNHHVGAQLYLGLCYWRGDGVERDHAQAEKWWSDACIQGIVPWRYSAGEEPLGDGPDVEKWWQQVAEQANASLQCCLAESYHFGHGVSLDNPRAIGWYRKAALGGDLVAMRRLAWLLATCPNPKVRDGASAVEFGEMAAAATKNQDASTLDTLAAAYAEAAQFEKAVRAEKQALELVQRDDEKREYQSRLKLYEARNPYRADEPGPEQP